jgi:S-adenosylmethionine-diacylglycerol 3-amino-3-carboxypropyl transferase
MPSASTRPLPGQSASTPPVGPPTRSPATTNRSRLRTAVHHHRITTRRGMLERMFTLWFKGFVYNQIWEDPRVDAEALCLGPGSRILTISSGGCNVLNYLVHRPEKIVAVDLNANHMCLTRLKLAAIRHLPDYETFYRFFGLGRHPDNVSNYNRYIRDHLDPTTRRFWESTDWPGRTIGPKRISYFKRGLYNQAKLGQFLRIVHAIARAARRDPSRLLAASSRAEQEQVFDETFGALFENAFIRWMGRQPVAVYSLGIPPSQHAVMLEESGGCGQRLFDLYRERVKRLACGFPLEDNYFAWQAFGRRYDHERRRAVPDYLRPEHYETVRGLVDRVETHVASLSDYLESAPAGSLTGFVLLDSQDWMPPAVIESLWGEIGRAAAPGARVIFRTAGEKSPVESALSTSTRGLYDYREDRSRELHLQDRSAIYGMFHLYERSGRPVESAVTDGRAMPEGSPPMPGSSDGLPDGNGAA